jgi:hypothetical protein
MFNCKSCSRTFNRIGDLKQHEKFCKGDKFCQNPKCRIKLTLQQTKFCSTKCSAKVTLIGRKLSEETRNKISLKLGGNGKLSKKNCINCGKKAYIKYCSIKCYHDYVWINITIKKIEGGSGNEYHCKKYLIEKFGNKCFDCGQCDIWNNKPLTLHLHHIDGNSDNNLLVNLKLLCPNCHTQTETYGSKGLGNRYKKQTKRNIYLQEYKGE